MTEIDSAAAGTPWPTNRRQGEGGHDGQQEAGEGVHGVHDQHQDPVEPPPGVARPPGPSGTPITMAKAVDRITTWKARRVPKTTRENTS